MAGAVVTFELVLLDKGTDSKPSLCEYFDSIKRV